MLDAPPRIARSGYKRKFIRNLIKSAGFFFLLLFLLLGRRFWFRRVHSTCAHTRRTTQWDANRCGGSHWCIAAWLRMWLFRNEQRAVRVSESLPNEWNLFDWSVRRHNFFNAPADISPTRFNEFHIFSPLCSLHSISLPRCYGIWIEFRKVFFFTPTFHCGKLITSPVPGVNPLQRIFFGVLTSSHEANWKWNSKW